MKGRFKDAVTKNFSRILYINKEEKSKKGVKEGRDSGRVGGKERIKERIKERKESTFMRAIQANSRGILIKCMLELINNGVIYTCMFPSKVERT